MSLIEILSKEQFNEFMIGLQTKKYKYVIAYFYSPSCMLCKHMISPLINKLYDLYQDKLIFIQIDISNENLVEIAKNNHISYVPAIIIFELDDSKIKCELILGSNINKLIEEKIKNII